MAIINFQGLLYNAKMWHLWASGDGNGDGSSSIVTEYETNPSNFPFFQAVASTGVSGTISIIEWTATCSFTTDSGSPETIAYKLQYKESGGSWTDLDSGNLTTAASDVVVMTGISEGLSLTLPIQFRIIGTDADANWKMGMAESSDQGIYVTLYGATS